MCFIQKWTGQPTWPDTIKLYIKQKFIHWSTRRRLNNHCNNKGLLGMKQKRTETGFLHTSASRPFLIYLESHELYMAVHTTEWWISQRLVRPDRDQGMDHFLRDLHDFRAYFHEVYIHGMFWPYTFVNPKQHKNYNKDSALLVWLSSPPTCFWLLQRKDLYREYLSDDT